jgi:transposase-like protein
VLVQSKRDKHAALKLMRKLLKKYGFVPERMITDDFALLWRCGARPWD